MTWHQLTVRFDSWDSVEPTALTHLEPALAEAEHAGRLTAWFFMRKAEPGAAPDQRVQPCWRLRMLAPDESADAVLAVLRRHLSSTIPGIYEPEIHAFGGQAGMAVAHTLFHEDSRLVVTYLGLPTDSHVSVGRRELVMLLCSRLLRAAGQDWFEQGDVWARVAEHRRPAGELDPEQVRALQPAVHRLMTVDTAHLAHDSNSGLATVDWFPPFDRAGQQLTQLARSGQLHRGLRAVLAHHVLFLFNRWGLDSHTQTLLAQTACTLIFD